MKRGSITIALLCLLCPLACLAQSFSGTWFGRAEVKSNQTYNTYLMELAIVKKGSLITGTLIYHFGKENFTQKVTGKYFPASKTIELNPFNLITFFASDKNAPDCVMDGSLTLYVYEGDSVLYGQLNPVGKYRNSCPMMMVSLNKEKPELTELSLKPAPEETNPISIFKEENPPVLKEDTIPGVKLETIPVSKVDTVPVLQVDTIPVTKVETITVSKVDSPFIPVAEIPVMVEELNKRKFVEGPIIWIDTDSIELHLYDNGKIDNDTVSVFFNRRPIAEKKQLSLKPIIIKLALEPGINEIAMFAINLGDIPPNTALCIVYAGKQRHDINLSSNLATNGTIRIQKREKAPEK